MAGLPTPDQLQPTGPEVPKPKGPEIKPVEKPLGPTEQRIVQQIDQHGDPDRALQDILGDNRKQTAEPILTGQFEEAQPGSGPPIVGDEIISPTARRVGETDDRAATERGWSSAIVRANARKDIPDTQRQQNLQEIVNAARAAGVPREQIGKQLQLLGINTIRQEDLAQSLEQKSSDDNSLDSDIERRALKIEPLVVRGVKENPDIQRRTANPNSITYDQNGEVIDVKYGNADWYKIKGKAAVGSVNGENKKFIFASSGGGDASYEPLTDRYTIGPHAVELFKQDPEMFMSAFLHEAGHDKYFSLSEVQQRGLNDLILQNPQLRDALFRFGATLYTDKQVIEGSEAGENYLKVHSVDNDTTRQTTISPDGQKGLKDTRSLLMNINGQQREVFAGLLITEFVSYMSTLQMGRELFDRTSGVGRTRRGGEDPRYDAIFLGFNRMQANPQTKAEFDSYGIFRDNTPHFASDLTKVLQTA